MKLSRLFLRKLSSVRPIFVFLSALLAFGSVFCGSSESLAETSGSADVSAVSVWQPAEIKSTELRPADAILLFGRTSDGELVNRFLSKEGTPADWKVEDDCLISTSRPVDAQNPVRSSHIYSAEMFRDAEIHVEFMVDSKSAGNSGVYIHGNYEIQIMDSASTSELGSNVTGAIYGIHPPKVNASKPAGEWQTLDVLYLAPRRNSEGKIVQKGKITAWLNGQLIQENSEFEEPVSNYHPYRYGATPGLKEIWDRQIQTGIGPVFLQDHQSPTKFRNVWIRRVEN